MSFRFLFQTVSKDEPMSHVPRPMRLAVVPHVRGRRRLPEVPGLGASERERRARGKRGLPSFRRLQKGASLLSWEEKTSVFVGGEAKASSFLLGGITSGLFWVREKSMWGCVQRSFARSARPQLIFG